MRKTGSAVAIATLLFLSVRIAGTLAPSPLAALPLELLSVLLPAAALYLLGELRGAQGLLLLPKREALPLLFLLPLFITLTALLAIPSALLADALKLNRTAELSGPLPLLLLTAALLPAVVEELFCRGVCLYPLGIGKTAAVWLSAILFASLHLNFAQLPYAFAAGLLLGALVSVSRSVWLPILFHLSNNAASLLIWYFGADQMRVLLALGLLGLLPLLFPRVQRAARELILRVVPRREDLKEIRAALLSPFSLPILICLFLSVL